MMYKRVNRRFGIPSVFAIISILAVHCGNSTSKQNEKAEYDNNYLSENNDTTMIDSLIDKNYLLGKFNPAKEDNFVKISSQHTTKSAAYLRKDTYEAFKKMRIAAAEEGISLTIVSATRNFDAQKGIWEAKWTGKRKVDGKDLRTVKNPVERSKIILLYSSMPGTSRHHWGTDIDINSVAPSYFETKKGKREYAWLCENAISFGFCQTYTKKDSLRPTGYEEEKWHWSYIPVSKELTIQYKKQISYSDISGFKGHETAKEIDVIKNFVLGINQDCLK